MGLNKYRNKPCPCGSGMKFKFCCLQDRYKEQAGLVTRLIKKIQEKTAKYWRKRYKTVTDKPLNEPLVGKCESCEGSGLDHDENGCEIDDVCGECNGSDSANIE